MDLKKFWKESFGGFVLKNLLIAAGIVVAVVWIALICIDFYTHHGESEIVPDLRGSYMEEAEIVLAKKGLYAKVIDSVYVSGKKLGTIVDQIPAPNSSVKSNRPIYIIINSRQVRQITLPNVNDVSFRQADAMLQSLGISVSGTESAPSEFKDLVIEVKYLGRTILPGTRIPDGSSVVLVVGSGLGSVEAPVPAIKGKTLEAATEELSTAGFVVGAVQYDVPPSGNEDDYIVYRQKPIANASLPVGSRIDLYLSKDKSRVNEVFEEDKKKDNEEEFF
jgi:beta-lactam-binding protein with PASTA domain